MLLAPQLTEFCCEEGTTFEALLKQAGAGPAACGFDCAHTWSTYGVGCGTFLQRKHPGFGAFSPLCDATVAQMTVGELKEGEDAEQTFDVEQGLVYTIASTPSAGLLHTALAIEAPHSNQLLADRVDVSKHGAGAHHIEWDALETEGGITVQVESLQGAGAFHVDAKIIGTTEHLAVQAVLNRPDVLLTIRCRWFNDCSFDYDGLQYLVEYLHKDVAGGVLGNETWDNADFRGCLIFPGGGDNSDKCKEVGCCA